MFDLSGSRRRACVSEEIRDIVLLRSCSEDRVWRIKVWIFRGIFKWKFLSEA